MKGFVVVKNLKGNLADIMSSIPEGATDYTLLVDVALSQKLVDTVEPDEEDNDITFIFKPTSPMRLIKKDYERNTEPTTEFELRDGHITGGVEQDESVIENA